jgi:hypothetical protein
MREEVKRFMETEQFKKFDEGCRKYLEDVKEKALSDLNQTEADIFNRWWKGEQIDWNTVPEKTSSAILWACGQGAG